MEPTYCLLLRKVTRGTQDDDDGVILEFHGAVERCHVSYALDPTAQKHTRTTKLKKEF